MSQKYLHLLISTFLIACLLLVAMTACKQELPQEFRNELEADILRTYPEAGDFVISNAR